jgi:hypothetical protein
MKTRKRMVILLAVIALVAIALPAVAVAAGGAFVDDESSVFEADINWLSGAGVTAGCNPPINDRFCPNDNVTRGQMAAFMRRFAGFLGAEDGIVSHADVASNADTLDGYDSSAFMGNTGYSVYNNGPIDIPTGFTTLVTLPDLPPGSYLFIAKAWFHHGGVSGEQYGQCRLAAGADNDLTVATLVSSNDGIPATWTVVHTFTAPTNQVELLCDDGGNAVSLNDAKITGIRLDSLTNQAG